MAGKKEVIHNFKACESFSEWINRAVVILDRPKSEVIRCCLLLSLPTLCANPSLIDHTRFEDTRKDLFCQ